MAGPETSLALGRTELPELAPLTPAGTALAPTNVAPAGGAPSADQLVQGQQQASRMYQLDPNYRPAREQRDPIQLKQGQWLGNGQMQESRTAAGDPLFAATMAVPTFEVDRSLSNVRKQKEDLAKWMEEATGQFKGRASDPYQEAYQGYVSDEHNKFFQDVADSYFGGDRSKAIQAVRRDPELNRQFMNMNRSLGAIGDANKSGYAYYAKVDDAITKGEADVDPETRKLLDSALNGEWSFNGQGPANNAAQFDRLNDRLSLNKLFDDFYREGIASAGDVTEGVGEMKWSVERDPKTGRKFLVIPKETNYDEFVEGFVDQAMKDGPYRDKEEVREFIEARVPRENTVKVNELALGTGGRAAKEEKKPSVGFAEIGFDTTVPGMKQTESDGVKRRTPGQTISMPLINEDGKAYSDAFRFNNKSGTPTRIIPDGFRVTESGDAFIVGRNDDVTQTQTANQDRAAILKIEVADLSAMIKTESESTPKEGETDEQQQERIAKMKRERERKVMEAGRLEREVTKEKPNESIPFKGNEAKVKTYFGEEVYNNVMKQIEAVKQQKAAKKTTADPLGIL